VTGYTDNTPIGSGLQQRRIEPPLHLSLQRAQAVAQYFIAHGVDPSLLTAQALQNPDPVALHDTAGQDRIQDNRFELTLRGPGN
jgi:flagellar motor protein MotB